MVNQPELNQIHLEVIGAGLWRTGTASLTEALEQLYNQPCYHMYKVLKVHKQAHINKWIEVFENEKAKVSKEKRRSDLSQLLQGYTACLDAPCVLFYKDLIEMCPNAKIILTVRDNTKVWIDSTRSTVSPRDLFSASNPWTYKFVSWCYGHAGFTYLNQLLEVYFAGSREEYESDAVYATRYEEWIQDVKRTVPSDRLLVFNVKEGWAPLCKFLNKSIPNTPFPYVNDKIETQKFLNRPRLLSNALLLSFVGCIFASGLTTIWYNKTSL